MHALFLTGCLVLSLALSAQAAPEAGGLECARLQCEYRDNPLGIDAQPPRLSWIVTSPAQGARQTAYQVLVASSREKLQQDTGDLWDSGKVASNDTVLVPYGGAALQSAQQCFWKVRAWDANDQPGPWSEAAEWTMGLLQPEDWLGAYIGLTEAQGNPEYPQLRRTFELEGTPERALCFVNALGYYELYVNGEKVDDYELSPGVTQFNKRSYYLTHDITPHVREGRNTIGIWMGPGWYADELPGVAHAGPLVRAQALFELSNGIAWTIATGASWQVRPSQYHRLGTWTPPFFGGERYDAAAEQTDWSTPDAAGEGWSAAAEIAPVEHVVSAQPAEPNRIQETLSPREIRKEAEGQWLIDFGKNSTGIFEITLPGLPKGHEVAFEYGDRLHEGELDVLGQRDEYVASGEEDEEHFRNRFNYRAGRYVRVFNLPEKPALDAAKMHLVRTDFPNFTSFACSNKTLTQVHDMVHYTLECLSLGGYQVDCPHIERLGYGGDGQASTPTNMTMYGMGGLYTSWLNAWRDNQRPDGDMPHTAPNPWHAGGGPYWCGFIIAASWEMYQDYGDERILGVNYPNMLAWMGYVQRHSEDGLLMGWPDVEYRNWYLGDWARPLRNESEAERSLHLVNNCFIVQCWDWMADIAKALGRDDEAAAHAREADGWRERTHAHFWDAERKTYADDTQLSLAYPLLVGVVPEDLRETVLARLEHKIMVEFDGHLDVGLVGVPILTTSLSELDRNDLVFSYASKRTFPSWGYMIENGATTTWEHWDAMRSHIHNCYNGIGVWFYRELAGIKPDPAAPGYGHFFLEPAAPGDVTWVQARQDTVRGAIESNWRIEGGQFNWNVLVPANTTATIAVPTADADAVQVDGAPAKENPGLRFAESRDGRAVFEAEAGRYRFSVPYNEAK